MPVQTPDQVIQALLNARDSGDIAAIGAGLRDAAAQRADDLASMLEIADRLIDLPQDDLARDCLDVMDDQWPGMPQVGLRRVQLSARFDDRAVAIQKASDLVARFPNTLNGHILWADLLVHAGQFDAAIDVMTQAAERFPDYPQPSLRLGRLYLWRDDLETALAHIQRARALDPDLAAAALAEAEILGKMGRNTEVVPLLETLVTQPTAPLWVFIQLINAATQAQDTELLGTRIRQGLARFPDDPALLNFLAWGSMPGAAYLSADDLDGLLRDRLPSEDVTALHVALLMKACDFKGALACSRGVGPRRSARQAVQVARSLIELNQLKLALRYLRFCLRRWPTELTLIWPTEVAFIGMGRAAEGIELLKDCAQRLTQAGHAVSADLEFTYDQSMAQLRFSMGEFASGLQHYQAAKAHKDMPYRHTSGFIRALTGAGDIENTRDLLADLSATMGAFHRRPLSSFEGQLGMEIGLELEAETSAMKQEIAPDDTGGHVQMMQDFPRSNVAGMRFIHHWVTHDLVRPAGQVDAPQDIPAIVHQYWDEPTPPEEISAMIDGWRAAAEGAGYTHNLWNKQTAITRLRKEFGPRWVQAFLMSYNAAQEADFLRLCLLAKDGGIYADADDVLTGSLPLLLDRPDRAGLVVYTETPGFSLGNNFLIARPGHPAIVLAARMARQALLMRSSEITWSKTGPGLLTRAVARYMARQIAQGQPVDVTVLPMSDVVQNIRMHSPVPHKRGVGDWRHDNTITVPDVFGLVLGEHLQNAQVNAA